MTYTHGEYKDTPCGRTKNLNFSGSCGVSLSVSLVCSSCQNIGSEGG
jgi:hypothetical protein